MKRKLFNRCCLALTGCAILPIGLSTVLSSCTKEEEITTISFPSYNISTNKLISTLVFKSSLPDETNVHFEIVVESSGLLQIITPDVTITNGGGEIKINITDSFIDSTQFKFSLLCSFPNDPQIASVIAENFNLFYTYQPRSDEDLIRAKQSSCLNLNDYKFKYIIQFKEMPLSPIKVRLIDSDYHILSFDNWPNSTPLLEWTDEVQLIDDVISIPLTLYMDACVFQQFTDMFSLEVSFINSSGVHQKTIIDKLTSTLLFKKNLDEFPVDFFNIKDGVLDGFRKDVTYEILDNFRTIRIPDNVTWIRDLCPEINKNEAYEFGKKCHNIILGKNVKGIENDAFSDYTNVQLVDFSKVEGVKADTDLFIGDSAFPTAQMSPSCIIIFPDGDETSLRAWNKILKPFIDAQITLFSTKEVTPIECFDLRENLDGTVDIEGIDSDYIDDLKNYAIIRFPDNTRSVDSKALKYFGEHPYVYNNQQVARFLLLNDSLTNIQGHGTFKNLGVQGIIDIPYFLENISHECFVNFDKYETGETITTSLAYINMDHMNKLINIDSSAFLDVKKIDNVILPNTTTTIAGNAFNGSSIEELKVPNKIRSVETAAFFNTSSFNSMDFTTYVEPPLWLNVRDPAKRFFNDTTGTKSKQWNWIHISKDANKENWKVALEQSGLLVDTETTEGTAYKGYWIIVNDE